MFIKFTTERFCVTRLHQWISMNNLICYFSSHCPLIFLFTFCHFQVFFFLFFLQLIAVSKLNWMCIWCSPVHYFVTTVKKTIYILELVCLAFGVHFSDYNDSNFIFWNRIFGWIPIWYTLFYYIFSDPLYFGIFFLLAGYIIPVHFFVITVMKTPYILELQVHCSI